MQGYGGFYFSERKDKRKAGKMLHILYPGTRIIKKDCKLYEGLQSCSYSRCDPYFNSKLSINLVVKFPSRKSSFCISC